MVIQYCEYYRLTSTKQVKQQCVTDELIEPFMCCTSDCDITSFKTDYIGAIHKTIQTDEAAALQLARMVLTNAKKIWVRKTYYRTTRNNYGDVLSGIKAKAIKQYI